MMMPANLGQLGWACTESNLQRSFMWKGGFQAEAGLHHSEISQDIVRVRVFWSPSLRDEAHANPTLGQPPDKERGAVDGKLEPFGIRRIQIQKDGDGLILIASVFANLQFACMRSRSPIHVS